MIIEALILYLVVAAILFLVAEGTGDPIFGLFVGIMLVAAAFWCITDGVVFISGSNETITQNITSIIVTYNGTITNASASFPQYVFTAEANSTAPFNTNPPFSTYILLGTYKFFPQNNISYISYFNINLTYNSINWPESVCWKCVHDGTLAEIETCAWIPDPGLVNLTLDCSSIITLNNDAQNISSWLLQGDTNYAISGVFDISYNTTPIYLPEINGTITSQTSTGGTNSTSINNYSPVAAGISGFNFSPFLGLLFLGIAIYMFFHFGFKVLKLK